MDSAPVIIGSKSKFARKHDEAKAAVKKRAAPKLQMVDVYRGERFLRTMPLPLLTRFSGLAAHVFSKPDKSDDKDKASETNEEPEAALKNLRVAEGDQGNTGTESTQVEAHKVLVLGLDEVNQLPPSALNFCLEWMDVNKQNGQFLVPFWVPIPFWVPNAQQVPLHEIIDLYAACLCFEIRPFPHQLRRDIYTRLTFDKPMAAHVEYISARVPLGDGVVTRMITSYFQHYEKHHYTEDEAGEIKDLVSKSDSLYQHFANVDQARWDNQERRREAGRAKWERAHRELAEATEGHRHGGKQVGGNHGKSTAPKVTNGNNDQAPGSSQTQGAGTTATAPVKSVKKGNGKGVGGRHVPGA